MNIVQIRGWQMNQLEFNLKSVEWLLRTSDPQALTQYRDGGTGWTALETLCHLRDYEGVFLERARLSMEQDNPTLPHSKPDDVAAERNYSSEKDLDAILTAWRANRGTFLAYLKARSETDWERAATHPVRGFLTLNDQLALVTMHDSNHIEQMTRTLYERK